MQNISLNPAIESINQTSITKTIQILLHTKIETRYHTKYNI